MISIYKRTQKTNKPPTISRLEILNDSEMATTHARLQIYAIIGLVITSKPRNAIKGIKGWGLEKAQQPAARASHKHADYNGFTDKVAEI